MANRVIAAQASPRPTSARHLLTAALAPCVRRQRRDQIAIAPASPSAPHLPRVPSLEAFGRPPRCKPNRRDGPSSETLHKSGGGGISKSSPLFSQQRTYIEESGTSVPTADL